MHFCLQFTYFTLASFHCNLMVSLTSGICCQYGLSDHRPWFSSQVIDMMLLALCFRAYYVTFPFCLIS
jgi:hypothetical protein